jgi:hypothetical protein
MPKVGQARQPVQGQLLVEVLRDEELDGEDALPVGLFGRVHVSDYNDTARAVLDRSCSFPAHRGDNDPVPLWRNACECAPLSA